MNWRLAEVTAAVVWPQAIARVVLDGWPADKAVGEAADRIKQIMAR